MPLKKKINFNIDKLKLSFKQPDRLFEELAKHHNNKYLVYGDFTLHVIDNGKKEGSDKPQTYILVNVLLADGTLLGQFHFNNCARFEGLCFFTYENAALYSDDVLLLLEIAEVLNLELKTITEIELAADINFNPVAKIRKLISDAENFDMIYNGKRINENRKIKDYGEWKGRSRKKVDLIPTLYFRQAKSDGLQMKIYNKTVEIEEESPTKSYILDRNNYGKQDTYRLEITIRWEQLKKWFDFLNSNAEFRAANDWYLRPQESNAHYLGRFLCLLTDETYKCLLWGFNADRLLYFRSRTTSEAVTLGDIANCATI